MQTSRAAKGLTSKKKSGLSHFNSFQESDNGRRIIITQTFKLSFYYIPGTGTLCKMLTMCYFINFYNNSMSKYYFYTHFANTGIE